MNQGIAYPDALWTEQDLTNLPFHGDFYRETHDVTRGLTISAASEMPGAWVNGHPCYAQPDKFEAISLGTRSLLCSETHNLSSERFLASNYPPRVPTDTFFKLEATTLYLSSCEPFDLGNKLLFFLSQEVSAMLTKVSLLKFSVKADVFVESLKCAIKARVYELEPERFAIEFQRRSGDVVCFNQVFKLAAIYFLQSPPAPVLLVAPAWSQGQLDSITSESDLTPLIEMAFSSSLQLQAEAAASLNKMSAERNAQSLCTQTVFQGIAALLLADSIDIAYPTACLVSHMADLPEAAGLFSANGLLVQILEKVKTPNTHMQVRLRLARAMKSAAHNLSEAGPGSGDAAKCLQALSALDLSWVSSTGLHQEVIANLKAAEAVLQSKSQTFH